jgi:hypothetical protein
VKNGNRKSSNGALPPVQNRGLKEIRKENRRAVFQTLKATTKTLHMTKLGTRQKSIGILPSSLIGV